MSANCPSSIIYVQTSHHPTRNVNRVVKKSSLRRTTSCKISLTPVWHVWRLNISQTWLGIGTVFLSIGPNWGPGRALNFFVTPPTFFPRANSIRKIFTNCRTKNSQMPINQDNLVHFLHNNLPMIANRNFCHLHF